MRNSGKYGKNRFVDKLFLMEALLVCDSVTVKETAQTISTSSEQALLP